jgi:hypothetical protein
LPVNIEQRVDVLVAQGQGLGEAVKQVALHAQRS